MMKKSLILFAVLYGLQGFGAESSGKAYAEYLAPMVEQTRKILATPPAAKMRREDPRSDVTSMIRQAESAYRYGKAVQDPEAVKMALEMYGKFLDMKPVMGARGGFHHVAPWAMMTSAMLKNGDLTPELRQRLQPLAEITFKDFNPRSDSFARFDGIFWDSNIMFGKMLGVSAMLQVFPDLPRAAEARKRMNQALDLVVARGGMTECSTNYEPLEWLFYLNLLKQENRLGDLKKHPNFRRTFDRWRDFGAPSAMVPEISDSYFLHNMIPVDIIYMLEFAGRYFNDPSYLAEARRLMRRFDVKAFHGSVDQLYRFSSLCELPSAQFDEKAPRSRSVVAKRSIAPGKELFAEFILRTGDAPSDAMAMLDLYSVGSHAHLFRRPAIAYYEADGAPLFHNLGRRGNLGGNKGNVFWVDSKNVNFPGNFKAKVWNTQQIPVAKLNADGICDLGKAIWFRTFSQRDVGNVYLADMRLEGAAGVKKIDDFTDTSLWTNFKGEQYPLDNIRVIDDPDFGRVAQLNWNKLSNDSRMPLTRKFKTGMKIDPAQYDTLKFEIKYDGATPYAHLRSGADDIDIGCSPLTTSVTAATVRDIGPDACGKIEFADYNGSGNKLERQLVLTREGVLVILDTFIPGKKAKFSTVGQLWQLYSMAGKGDDYFVAESDGAFPRVDGTKAPARRMLVKYFRDKNTEVGHFENPPGYLSAYRLDENGKRINYKNFVTTHSKKVLGGGDAPQTFAQVIFPAGKDEDAAALARKIRFLRIGDRSGEIEVPAAGSGAPVKIKINRGDVTVERR